MDDKTPRIIDEIEAQAVESRRRFTPKQRRFIRGIVEGKTAKKSAEDAGYSPKSAQVIGSRLLKHPDIQSELAQHFIDEEEAVSRILRKSLLRTENIVDTGDNKEFIKSFKNLLDYTRLASNVLGLKVKPSKASLEDEAGDLDRDALIRAHEEEIAKLKRLSPTDGLLNATPKE